MIFHHNGHECGIFKLLGLRDGIVRMAGEISPVTALIAQLDESFIILRHKIDHLTPPPPPPFTSKAIAAPWPQLTHDRNDAQVGFVQRYSVPTCMRYSVVILTRVKPHAFNVSFLVKPSPTHYIRKNTRSSYLWVCLQRMEKQLRRSGYWQAEEVELMLSTLLDLNAGRRVMRSTHLPAILLFRKVAHNLTNAG